MGSVDEANGGEIETIGSRIRDARNARGKTTAWLANELRVTENAVKAIEDSTTKSPSFTNGLAIARVLGADPYWIAFGTTPPSIAGETAIRSVQDVLLEKIEFLETAAQDTRARLEALESRVPPARNRVRKAAS